MRFKTKILVIEEDKGTGKRIEYWDKFEFDATKYVSHLEHEQGSILYLSGVKHPFVVEFSFEDTVKGGHIPREYISSCRKGAEDAMNSGVIAGFPVEDVHVQLIDGSHHEVDSSEMAFRTALGRSS